MKLNELFGKGKNKNSSARDVLERIRDDWHVFGNMPDSELFPDGSDPKLAAIMDKVDDGLDDISKILKKLGR
jgi:hypothetical protein